jgi:hypothetical protein
MTKGELEKIKKQYKTSRLFSWSMVSTFTTSPYEYLLKYILHTPEDLNNCVYASMGGMAHDILEKLYNGEIKYDDMEDEFETAWSMAVDISDLKFDRNDEEHNKKLSDKYYDDLKHFFKYHTKIPYKTVTEQFLVTKINDYVLQGYLDIIFKDEEGFYNIIDFKTSSIYTGKNLLEKSGQLCVYAKGLNQKGVPIDKIKIGFNFLKYVTVQYQQANGSVKERNIERFEIGTKLQSNAKMWLKKLGYENKVDEYLKDLVDYNDISVLPEDVQAKYRITDCYVYIPLTEKLLDKWSDKISETIKDILWREEQYAQDENDKWFFDTEESVKKESYYFSTLCSYSAELHKPYKLYLDKLQATQEDSDLFSGLFSGVGSEVKNNDEQSREINKAIHQNGVDDDLSWLDELV